MPYAGKVAINGLNFSGNAQFTFALRDADGTIRWRNGADANATINVPVDRGHYLVFLGGQGMNPIPPSLFLDYPELYLQVHFDDGTARGRLHLQPDQRINSAPHALSAEVAKLADLATLADAVKPGAITKNMLAADVLADLNATVVIPEQNATLQPGSVTLSHLSAGVRADLNATPPPGSVTLAMLSPQVRADLNRTITITRNMMPASVLADINATITRSRLAADILSDLNATIPRSRIAAEVLADINATITRSRLAADVLADLNRTFTISPGTVTESMLAAGTVTPGKLSPDVTAALKPVILRQPQSVSAIGGTSATFVTQATGGNLSYQWLQQGYAIAGANGNVLTITDLNATLHDGNYSVTVTNAFGSTTSAVATLDVNGSVTQGLVAYYPFDGNGSDMSGNSHHGTVNGATLGLDRLGMASRAYYLDGVDDFIDVQDSNALDFGSDDFTVSGWVKILSPITDWKGFFMGKWNNAASPSTNEWAIFLTSSPNNTIPAFWVENSNNLTQLTSQSALDVNKWFYLVALRTGTELRFYQDTVLKSINSSFSGTTNNVGINLTFGKFSPSNPLYSNIAIDDVRIYDRELSAAEIHALYDLGTAAPATTTTVGGASIVADSGPVTTEKLSDGAVTTEKLAADAITLAKLASLASYLSPAIKTHPAGTIGYLDDSVNFTVEGEGRNLSYQWKKDGVPIPGATAPTLSLTDLNATMAGSYLAAVSNDFGTVSSSPTTLIVQDSYFTTIGLQLWLDAHDVDGNGLPDNLADGVTISNWTDKSGNERNATQAVQSKRPIVKLAAMNGKAVMRFDGVDDHYADVFDVNTQNKTVFFVFSHDHPNTVNPRGPIYQNKNLITSGFFPSFEGDQHLSWGSNWLTKTSGFSRNTAYVGTVVHGASFTKLYQDGLLNHDTAQNSTPTDGKFQIAYRGVNNDHFRGDIAELLVFNRDLSDEERGQVEKYLGKKWGVDVGLDADLVGWWKFDETSGTIAHDSSGNDNNGTLTNGPTWAQGKIGGALSFDGVNDYVLLPATADLDLQTLTISAWVYSTNYNQYGFIFEKTANGIVNTQYSFFFHGSYTELWFRTVKNGSRDDARPSASGWSGWLLTSVTFDGSVKRIYVNGVQKVEKAWVGPITTGATGISSIGAIHNYNGPTNWHFNGLIDDVRIYDRALTAAEVQALYQTGN